MDKHLRIVLDRKIKYNEMVVSLQEKVQRTKGDEERLQMYKTLFETTDQNQSFYLSFMMLTALTGLVVSAYGARQWNKTVQKRDDQIADLQIKKLEHEIKKLSVDISIAEKQNSKVSFNEERD